MKKMLCLILVAVLCFSLCGCDLISQFTGEKQSAVAPAQAQAGPVTVTLPDFQGQSLEKAAKWLDGAGVTTEIQYAYSADVAEGIIMEQSIPAASEVSADMTLVLTVSQGEETCPYPYSQKLTVSAAPGSTYATATLYEWRTGGWYQVTSYSARVGYNGIGVGQEGSQRTPQGIHDLGVVLCANAVNTNLPVRTVYESTCVVDDTGSPYYNMIMENYQVPANTSYDQIGRSLTNGTTYATIYIEHNGSGLSASGVVSGKGSAIGIRGQYGSLNATYGDVDISHTDMVDLLSRLDVNKHPVIEIVLK